MTYSNRHNSCDFQDDTYKRKEREVSYLEYKNFVETIKRSLEKTLEGRCEVRLHHTMKNNGVEVMGVIMMNNHDEITPAIYMQEYYKAYQGGMNLQEIAEKIVLEYEAHLQSKFPFPLNFFHDFEQVKSKVAYKLIHRGRNEKLLKEIPFVPYLDLAIVFYCLASTQEGQTGTILIREEHLSYWGISLEVLKQEAIKNTPVMLPELFQNIDDFIRQASGMSSSEGKENQEKTALYVLTNQLQCFGSAALLYPEVLKGIGEEFNSSFYIIPSSIHECICVSIKEEVTIRELKDMLEHGNRTEITELEFLSDQIYLYNRIEESLQIAEEKRKY